MTLKEVGGKVLRQLGQDDFKRVTKVLERVQLPDWYTGEGEEECDGEYGAIDAGTSSSCPASDSLALALVPVAKPAPSSRLIIPDWLNNRVASPPKAPQALDAPKTPQAPKAPITPKAPNDPESPSDSSGSQGSPGSHHLGTGYGSSSGACTS